MSFPDPMPSVSTPVKQLSTEIRADRRPRRHTITRPDSAMALLSDMEEDGDDDEQQQTFDRISGILSSLIQEANDAVHGIEQERVHLMKSTSTSNRRPSKTPRLFTSSTIITNHTTKSDTSKIPRPRRSRTLNTSSSGHHRNVSSSSSSSATSTNTASALFSPNSTSTSATLSRSPSPTLANFKKQLFRHHTTLRPRSCPIIVPPRRSMTPRTKRSSLVSDPILESFKRLDTSMALVDSLSRDLATPKSKDNNSLIDSRLTFLILVPLLHIPHSLITMIFDFCSSSSVSTNNHMHLRNTPTSSFSISCMIFWACVFAVTNLMVDQVAVTPKTKQYLISKVRRMSLPGSYNMTEKKKSIKKPTKDSKQTVIVPVKRTWIPATIQKQYQFRLGEEMPPPQIRRNSI